MPGLPIVQWDEPERAALSQPKLCRTHHVLLLQALEGEYAALQDEHRAVAEDLEVLVRENQVVSQQLATAATER